MAGTTAGTLSNVSALSNQIVNTQSVATGGTTPYTYAYYRSTVSGFTPGVGNAIGTPGTNPLITDSGLTPGTQYYYKSIITDSNATPSLATATQLAVATIAASPNPNQFAQGTFLGMIDLSFNPSTLSVQFDPAGTGSIVGGSALKWSTVAGPSAPKVLLSTAQADVIAGFAIYNFKDQSYSPGEYLEMAVSGNAIYLYATAAINRGTELVSIPAAVAGGCSGGVAAVTGSSGFPVMGYALDTAVSGALFRVMLQCPSNKLDS
jgi:hypothetical protein